MTKTKDKILKKLIKKSELNTPSIDFTDSIIEQLQINVEKALNSDTSFAHLLHEKSTPIISNNFSENIISNIQKPKTKLIIQPIISKKLRIIFTSTLLFLIIFSFFIRKKTTTSSNSTFNFIDKVGVFLSQNLTPEAQSIVFICIISFSLLLLFDYLIKKKLFFFSIKY